MTKVITKNARVDNKYETILLAAHRARNLELGAKPVIEIENKKGKHALLALIEIESGKIDTKELREAIANQGNSSIKTTEVVIESKKQQSRDHLLYKKENLSLEKGEVTTTKKENIIEEIIYKDEEKIEY
jgi:DNA-directed RNA polymerase omega subunit